MYNPVANNSFTPVPTNYGLFWEYLDNWDLMYDSTVSPYGGLVLIVAETGFVVNIWDGVYQNEWYNPWIVIWGINGVTGFVQFSRHLDFSADTALGI